MSKKAALVEVDDPYGDEEGNLKDDDDEANLREIEEYMFNNVSALLLM